MAKIVLGLGASHSPLLTLDWTEWRHRAEADRANRELNLSDGRFVTYEQLAEIAGERWHAIATPEEFEGAADRCNAGLDRLVDALEAADPDIVVIIGDDQAELFALSNTPAISVYYGDEIATHDMWGNGDRPAWLRQVAEGYAMDGVHRFPGAPQLGLDVIKGLIERDVDVGASSGVDDPVKSGFGHAYGFIIKRLFKKKSYPVLPILLNTYFPPNVIRSGRALEIGAKLRAAIEASPSDARVAVIASGGLSHFVVDEALDREVLAALEPSENHLLADIPPQALNSGSSEILNWIMTAGAVSHLKLAWVEYEPIRRTPAGTGVGVGFACWNDT